MGYRTIQQQCYANCLLVPIEVLLRSRPTVRKDWEIHQNPGSVFHDGCTVTLSLVVYSIRAFRLTPFL